MNTTNYIRIFRGDDSDALGYQTIVGTIKTDIDLTGCKAVFRFLGFYAEFDPIPEDGKLTIVIPAQASRGFPPGVGYASLKVFDSLGKIRTFTNRIPVIVDTMTPSCGGGEFEVSFSPFPELEPLKIFIGPNADDFDQYTGFLSKIIDRASLAKYGLVALADAMSQEGGASGKAASPLAVKAAYDAIIKELTDNYYTSDETDDAIDRVAAYYITYDAAGNPFPTYAALANAQTVYSGGQVRTPTRNDYCVVLADETHDNAEYRYIYAVADGETTGSWQPQFPVEGVMTVDQTVQKNSQNPVSGGGVWSAIWGALASLPTGFTSLYDWCVSQLAGKENIFTPATSSIIQGVLSVWADVKNGTTIYKMEIPTTTMLAGKASKADATLTEREYSDWSILHTPLTAEQKAALYNESADAAVNDYAVTIRGNNPYNLYVGDYNAASLSLSSDGLSYVFYVGSPEASAIWGPVGTTVATRTALQGYQLGTQTDMPLASEAEAEALRTGKQNALSAQQLANIAAVSDALAFDATHSYAAGDPVVYDGTLYTFTATHTGAWTGSDVSAVNIIARLAGKLSTSGGTMTGPLEMGEQPLEFGDGRYRIVKFGDGLAILDLDAITATKIPFSPTSEGTLALTADIPYNRITITTGQLQDHAEQKVTLNAATTTLSLPALTDLTGKVSDFGIDVVNAYEVSGTPTAASFSLAGTIGTDYNLIVPEGEDWSEMSALAAGEMAVYYFTLSAFQINDKPTWEVMKKVVELVPVPVAP